MEFKDKSLKDYYLTKFHTPLDAMNDPIIQVNYSQTSNRYTSIKFPIDLTYEELDASKLFKHLIPLPSSVCNLVVKRENTKIVEKDLIDNECDGN